MAEGGVAIVTGISGKVETARAGQETWRRAEVGLSLLMGDRLRTAEGATATLLLGNGQKLNVLPNSIVNVSAEMGKGGGRSSGVGKALKGLWSALAGKFDESKDISAAKGVVGTLRGPKKPLADAALSEEDKAQLAEQVTELEALDADAVSQNLLLAVAYEGAKQYARAEASYLKAIGADPGEGRLYDALGSLYTHLGQKEKLDALKEQKRKMVIAQETENSP
jgi:tetratricopeptide (TPR) repeat protein